MLVQANSGSCSEAGGIKDCILLQTGLDKTGRFQEAVGEAMAKRMKVGHHASFCGSTDAVHPPFHAYD